MDSSRSESAPEPIMVSMFFLAPEADPVPESVVFGGDVLAADSQPTAPK